MGNILASNNIRIEQIAVDERSKDEREIKNSNDTQDKDIPEWVKSRLFQDGSLFDKIKEKQGGV